MKEIYLDREKEIENMSKVYVESMNNYAQALEETEKGKNLINTDSIENSILINKLSEKKRILEEQINEFKKIKDESIGDDLPSIQNKISNMNQNVNHLNEKQKEFSSKIKKVNEFTNFMIKNNNIVNSLEQNITKNKKRKEYLENKINKMNIVGDEEINELKEKLQKLEQDKVTKEENIKNYEKKFQELIESMDNQEEVQTYVLKRLGDQKENYKHQIDKLLESKDNMQAYYIEEVKRLKDKIQMITAENNELKNDNQKLAEESKASKTVDELCNKEFKEFKDAFYSISDIENMISEFNKSSEEIKALRENLLADEFLKIKEDIKVKNKEIRILKNTTKDNVTSTNRVSTTKSFVTNNSINVNHNNVIKKKPENEIDEINRNIKLKLRIYNSLVNKKTKEVNGLEQHIKLIKDYNNYSKKSGENQELLCAENKIMTEEMINELNGLNQFEEELKREVEFLEQKLKMNEEAHSNSLQILNNNVNQQLNAIKERENYIVKQSEQITDGLKNIANQKKNAIDILKIENQQLKDRNYIINTKL
jgi:chromosome segregation ATPase